MMRSDIDMIDGTQFQNMMEDYANFNEHFAHMSIKQKTSYFVSFSQRLMCLLDYKLRFDEHLP